MKNEDEFKVYICHTEKQTLKWIKIVLYDKKVDVVNKKVRLKVHYKI